MQQRRSRPTGQDSERLWPRPAVASPADTGPIIVLALEPSRIRARRMIQWVRYHGEIGNPGLTVPGA